MARTVPTPEPVRRLCINCDNRHGCRTACPVCLTLEPQPGERLLSGRNLMARRGLLDLCRRCGLFRQCWSEAAYRHAVHRREQTWRLVGARETTRMRPYEG